MHASFGGLFTLPSICYVNLHFTVAVREGTGQSVRLDFATLSRSPEYISTCSVETACHIQACLMTLPFPLSATYWSTWSPIRPSATVIESVQRDQGEEWIGSWDAVGLYEALVLSSPSSRFL